MSETSKRTYRRLLPEEWSAARGLWESGRATVAEIATEFGVSERAIQMRFKKDGAVKGSTAADLSASVAHAVVSAEFGSIEDRIEKGRHARAGSFTLAGKIEACLSIIVDDISADPSTAYRHGQSLKALERAMATAERGFLLKEKALGLTAAETIDPLPIIEIRDLGESDIEAIRAVNDDGDDLPDAAAADV